MNDKQQTPHLPKPPRAWLTLLMGGLLLISGMVMGAGGTALILKHNIDQRDNAPKHFSKRLVGRMTRDLNLTEEQSQQVRTILEAHREEMYSIRMTIKDEVDASFETLKTEVEAILTPEQAEIWEQRIHEYRDRPPHERGPGGGGRGDGPRRQRRDQRMHDGSPRGDHFDGRRPPPRHGGDRNFRPPPPRDGEYRPPPPGEQGDGDEEFSPPPPQDDEL